MRKGWVDLTVISKHERNANYIHVCEAPPDAMEITTDVIGHQSPAELLIIPVIALPTMGHLIGKRVKILIWEDKEDESTRD